MKRITVKTNNRKLKIDIPESWGEVTYEKYKKFIQYVDGEQRLANLLGVDRSLFSVKNSIDIWEELANTCRFAFETQPKIEEYKGVIHFRGEIIHLPKDIRRNSIGQWEDVKILMKSCMVDDVVDENNLIDIYPKVVAIYVQDVIDGKYDGAKAMELANDIELLQCEDVLSLGSFFLSRLFKEKKSFLKTFLKIPLIKILKR